MSRLTSTKLHTLSPIPGGGVAGEAIARELPDDAGRYLVLVYRAVMLWTAQDADRRHGLFAEGSMWALATRIAETSADVGDSIRQPLILIACELGSEDPDLAVLARACLTVCDSAIQRGAFATALAFADAAASIGPSARYALVTGRLHRRYGTARHAEQWLRRASVLATRAGDWLTKIRALLSLGNVSLVAGCYGEANDYFREALKFAVRHRLRELAGEAWHDLFTVAMATNDRKAADAALRETLRSYKPVHPRLPAFAHDLALYWIKLNDFENARTVLLALLERHWLDDPALRLLACGTTLRAVGGCGRADEFDRLYGEFWRLVDTAGESAQLAQALLAAAHGAVSLRRWSTAETLSSAAAEQASKTGQHDTLHAAERVLSQVRDRRQESPPASNPQARREVARAAVLALGGSEAPR